MVDKNTLKYWSLKNRIDLIVGWTPSAEAIMEEISKELKEDYYISIPVKNADGFIGVYDSDFVFYFIKEYYNRNEKIQYFREALMWLLNSSRIWDRMWETAKGGLCKPNGRQKSN